MSAPARISSARLAALSERVSLRDLAILSSLRCVRVMTGAMIERAHFTDIEATARGRVRRRVMARLVEWRLACTLERRVGGVRAGSAGLIYALDSGGKRLLSGDQGDSSAAPRPRRPSTPGPLFLAHTLAVSELFVDLVERARDGFMRLDRFEAEPGCWWPDGQGGVIKPDAYTALVAAGSAWSWWLEVDRATESRETLRRKLAAYLAFAVGGQPGPDDVVPRVLVTVPDPQRLLFVRDIIDSLPSPADQMFDCELHQNAISYLVSQLR